LKKEAMSNLIKLLGPYLFSVNLLELGEKYYKIAAFAQKPKGLQHKVGTEFGTDLVRSTSPCG
jgi:hypothetical protein